MHNNSASQFPEQATLMLQPHIDRLDVASSAAFLSELCCSTSRAAAVPQQVHALPAAAAYLGYLSADEDLCCQAHNRYTALLLLGLLYGVPYAPRVAAGQASKQKEHLQQPVRGLWQPSVQLSMLQISEWYCSAALRHQAAPAAHMHSNAACLRLHAGM